jgi:DNA-binding NarL/FixJ family response regulator
MQTQEYPLIFIVEDNTLYNKLVASHLRMNKFQRIECFLSGEECLLNLYKNPDIIIQDYHMGGINGVDVLRKSKKTNPSTEFIFLSGDDSYEIAANTIKYGAYDYLIKDRFALKKLVDAINNIIKIHRIVPPKKRFRIGVPFFLITFTFMIVTYVSLPIIFPNIFTF